MPKPGMENFAEISQPHGLMLVCLDCAESSQFNRNASRDEIEREKAGHVCEPETAISSGGSRNSRATAA
jgi:hypothetical protein